ncbi:primase zinc finger [Botrytis cinerea]
MSQGGAEEAQWPPRSPREALLSTPGGRDRLRRYATGFSPTASPSKRRPAVQRSNEGRYVYGRDGGDDEDDEETLQLKLQEIQARLRLKQLQKKNKQSSDSEGEKIERNEQPESYRPASGLLRANSAATNRASSRLAGLGAAELRERQSQRPKSRTEVNVPASPPRRVQPAELPQSPGRVLLGIDKGLKGIDISLKRAPGLRKNLESDFNNSKRTGPFLQRSQSQTGNRIPASQSFNQVERPKSFSERMAAARITDTERQERAARIKKTRSTAFDIDQMQMESFKSNAIELPSHPAPTKEFSREEVLNSLNNSNGELRRHKTTSNLRSIPISSNETSARPLSQGPQSSFDSSRRPEIKNSHEIYAGLRRGSQDSQNSLDTSKRLAFRNGNGSQSSQSSFDTYRSALRNGTEAKFLSRPDSRDRRPDSQDKNTNARSFDNLNRTRSNSNMNKASSDTSDGEASQFEPYSTSHLSKRIIPHQVLTRSLQGKKTFLIPDLLRTVKAPDFAGPEIEEDVVVFATIAAKSAPRAHQDQAKNGGKFMVLTLTDLKWEIELFLFRTAFEKFWKLTPGTVIALLNPGFMPPARGKTDTGKFSLTLSSSDDTILEIGTNRDLGYCKSVKRDGKTCDTWVNTRHTEFCDYHVNLSLTKTHANRMEVNTMSFGPKRNFGGGGTEQKYNSRDMAGYKQRREELKKGEKTKYDRESHSQIYIGKRSAVSLLDDVDFDPDAFHRGSTKEDRMTKQILAQEKERELGRKLGMMGGGLGADYMKRRNPVPLNPQDTMNSDRELSPPDARKLGLIGAKPSVRLSPINKRKRANTIGGVKKKTRFVTAKGIREAGRESLGGPELDIELD